MKYKIRNLAERAWIKIPWNKLYARQITLTKLGDMPRATADPPIVYSSIKAQPINQATLEKYNIRTTLDHSSNLFVGSKV